MTFKNTNKIIFRQLGSSYCLPKYAIKKQHFLKYFHTLGQKYVVGVGGDYNSKPTHWGSQLTTTKGKELWSATH